MTSKGVLAGKYPSIERRTAELQGVRVATTSFVNGVPRTCLELVDTLEEHRFASGARLRSCTEASLRSGLCLFLLHHLGCPLAASGALIPHQYRRCGQLYLRSEGSYDQLYVYVPMSLHWCRAADKGAAVGCKANLGFFEQGERRGG